MIRRILGLLLRSRDRGSARLLGTACPGERARVAAPGRRARDSRAAGTFNREAHAAARDAGATDREAGGHF